MANLDNPAAEGDEQLADQSIGTHIVVALASGFGLGYVPIVPGVPASAAGALLVQQVRGSRVPRSIQWIVAIAVVLLGVPICYIGEAYFEQIDPVKVVYDEIAAFVVVYAFVTINWTTGLIGYALFLTCDYTKPWPVAQCERLPGGWGIMADDFAAALYAALIVWLGQQWRESRIHTNRTKTVFRKEATGGAGPT